MDSIDFLHLPLELFFLICKLLDYDSILSLSLTSWRARIPTIAFLWKSLSQDETSPLHWALDHHRVDLAKAFVDMYGADIDETDEGVSLLVYSCQRGFVKALGWLMSYKTLNVSSCDDDGRNALWWAAANMRYNDAMDLLIKHEHTDLNCQDRKDGSTPLMLSITYKNLELLEALLSDLRTDPNIVNRFGQSPLHLAVYRNSPQMIQLLVQSGADVNRMNDKRQTPLILAAEQQLPSAIRCLLSIPTVKIEYADNYGRTALWYAVDDCNTEIIQQLMERTSDVHDYWNAGYNKTLFQLAIERGCELAVIRLLQKSKSSHRPEDEGDEHLIYDDDTCFFMAVVSNQVSIARIFLARGANVNAYNEDGQTALHVACRYNNPRLVDLLFSHPQLDVNFPDHDLQTPLHIAICHDAYSLVERLLSMPGIEVDSKDSSGRTPLWCAADRMKISLVRQLQERGADCNPVACCGERFPDLKISAGLIILTLLGSQSRLYSISVGRPAQQCI